MKFRVEHDALAESVAWVARELPSRPVMPVMAGLRLEATEAGLALSCFDYDLAAAVQVPAEVSEPGTALVPGRLLADITRSLPGEPAEFASDGDEVTLTCDSAEFALVSLPLAEYPPLPPAPPVAGVIDGGELAAAIGQVLPAASKDDTLPVLTAVSLEIDGATITLAATDRYRLAVRRLGWQPSDTSLRALALVPARTLAGAARVMTAGVPVTVSLTAAGVEQEPGGQHPAEGMISFDSGGRRLSGRLLAGDFIRYESRFPAEFSCRAELPAAAFTEAVRRVSLVADRASPVQLSFGDGKVTISARTEGRARAVEAVTASFDGDSPVIAFNPQFLLDGLIATGTKSAAKDAAAAAGEDAGTPEPAEKPAKRRKGAQPDRDDAAGPATVQLDFTSPAKPALITAGTAGGGGAAGETPAEYRYLLVPLRPAGD